MLSYVGLSLPIGLALAFAGGFGSVGLMGGHVIGKTIHSVASLLLVMRTSWTSQSARAQQRVKRLRSSKAQESAAEAAMALEAALEPVGQQEEQSAIEIVPPAPGEQGEAAAAAGAPAPAAATGHVVEGRKQGAVSRLLAVPGGSRAPPHGAVRLEDE